MACCDSWGRKEPDTTERLIWSDLIWTVILEKAMAPHSSTLAGKIPWTEEPGGLQSMGSLRVGHDWATSFSLFTFMHWRRKWQPTPVFLPGKSQARGSLVGCVYGVTQSRTRLKRLSSSSSSNSDLYCVSKRKYFYYNKHKNHTMNINLKILWKKRQ